jgi:hypothetical protein
MRISALVRHLTLLLAFTSPVLLLAQFQQPTDEELKMTTDPKAPGAAAVYLYREEFTNDNSANGSIQRFYERIKVLTEKGKELATIRIPYYPGINKVIDIKGRTIHTDGTSIPFTGNPSEMVDIKTKSFQTGTVVFTLPSVEVGSILEYRYSYSGVIFLPTWWIQQPYFVHKAHYSYVYNPYGHQMYTTYLGSGAKLECCKHNTYSLDIADVPPLPSEDWMPPLNTLKWRVQFFYTRFHSGKEFWDDEGTSWTKVVQNFTKPTIELKNAVEGIVTPTDTDQQKAAKIYAAVQKLENTRFSRAKSEAERKKEKLKDIHNAEDVWKQKSGNDDEIALLYVALARAAGLKAWPMLVVDRSRAFFDNSYLTARQFDDYIALVVVDGKEIYLDPGQKMCPFGSLHWKHTLTSGLRLSDKGAVIEETPDGNYKDTVVQNIADISIGEDGSVKGKARVVLTGPEALYWRQLALQNDEDEVKKQFIESLRSSLPEGVQADIDQFVALDDSNANLVGVLKISGNIGAATGKRFIFPAFFFESRAKHPFVAQDKRITSIDLHYAKIEQDDVTFHLPSDYTLESAPESSEFSWYDHASLQITITAKEDSLELERILTRNFHLLKPSEYSDLRDFYLKVAVSDQQQLVFTRTPAAGKGNQ